MKADIAAMRFGRGMGHRRLNGSVVYRANGLAPTSGELTRGRVTSSDTPQADRLALSKCRFGTPYIYIYTPCSADSYLNPQSPHSVQLAERYVIGREGKGGVS